MDSQHETAWRALVFLRLTLAVGALGLPHFMAGLFGIDTHSQRAVPYLVRLFGARAAWLGTEVLLASDADRQRLLRLHVTIDTVDVVSSVLAGRGGQLPRRGVILSGGIALLAAMLGLVAGGGLPSRQDLSL